MDRTDSTNNAEQGQSPTLGKGLFPDPAWSIDYCNTNEG